MLPNIKNILKGMAMPLDLAFQAVGGKDYRALNEFILKINGYKDIEAIVQEVSICLKDILDCEFLGFVLKKDKTIDLWTDPSINAKPLIEQIKKDFQGQKIDFRLCFIGKVKKSSQNPDAPCTEKLLACPVLDNEHSAMLYLRPGKKPLFCHQHMLTVIVRSLRIALEHIFCIKKLEDLAAVDPLTGCYNRRALDRYLENDVAYAHRYGSNLSVIMFDIDDFKTVNDSYGHAVGDVVLKRICDLVGSVVRKSDFLARYGGEEFVLVLPDTSLRNALQLAEKLRKRIAAQKITVDDTIVSVTASFGIAALGTGADGAALLARADEMLYNAKSHGKNTVMPKPRSRMGALRAVAEQPDFRYA